MFHKKKNTRYPDSEIAFPELIQSNVYLKQSILSGRVQVSEYCRINEAFLSGEINIGRYTSLWGPGVSIYSFLNPVTIGSFCSIARHVSMQEYNHITNRLSTYFVHQNIFGGSMKNDITSKGGITIGHDVWIGAQTMILSGVNIGSGCVIGANSVVSSDLPPYSIAVGTPARVVQKRFSEEIIEALLKLSWWDWDIERIKRNQSLFEDQLTLDKLQDIKQ